MEDKRPIVGVALIVKKDNHILMGKRLGSRGANKYSTPGGHVEVGELLLTAVIREFKEEVGTNLIFSAPQYIEFTEDIYPDAHYITHFFMSKYLEGEPELLEPHKCEAWNWYPIDLLKSGQPNPMFKPCKTLFVDWAYFS